MKIIRQLLNCVLQLCSCLEANEQLIFVVIVVFYSFFSFSTPWAIKRTHLLGFNLVKC